MSTSSEPVHLELADGRTVELHDSVQRHPDEFGLGAYHEGELVGLLVCEPDAARNGHLTVFVVPDWRGVGLGAALVRAMADRARGLGVAYLSLSYSVDNVAASRMVSGSGLVVARRVRDGVEKAALLVPGAAVAA